VAAIAEKFAGGEIVDADALGLAVQAALQGLPSQSEQHDLSIAAKTQSRLLRHGLQRVAGLEVAFGSRPAGPLTGDLHDAIDLGNGRALIVVGDAVGKGPNAAVYAMLTLGAIRGRSLHGDSPSQLLLYLNGLLAPHTEGRDSVALCAMVWDRERNIAYLANAAMPLPILQRHDGAIEINVSGHALGWFDHSQYEDVPLSLSPGETLVLQSDGIADEECIRDRLRQGLQVRGSLATLCETVFGGTEGSQEDDQTLAVIRVMEG
jgi:serine phosphatase RsbU (regulator of sigma subunit)